MLRKILSFFSTQVGIAILLAIVVIVMATIIKTKGGNPSTNKSSTTLAVEKIVKKSLEDDTDGDGLKNWEEALYKTDPENPDTDGDGMNDEAEVSANRSPVISGTGHDASSTSTASILPTFSATDKFSQELFIKYIEAKKSGQEITQEFSDKLAEEIVAKDYGGQEVVFDANDLSTISNPTLTQIHDYGNAFGTAISIPVPKGVRNEFEILDSIIINGLSESDEKELQVLYDRYNSIHNSLAKIRVPIEIRNTHASFIRAVDTIRNSVSGMQNLNVDPIGALKKIALYEEGLNDLSVTSLNLKQYFFSKKIVFGSTESGSTLTR